MNIIKKLFTSHYHPKLIEMVTSSNLVASIVSGVVIPLVAGVVFYGLIPSSYLYTWLFLNFVVFFNRVYMIKKVSNALSVNDDALITKYLNAYFLVVSLSSILYGVLVWLCVIYTEDIYIFFAGMILLAIAAASLATLVSVFHIFVAFVSFQMLMFISACIYRGGEMFYLISVLGVAFLGIVLANGYRQYIILKNSISMEDTFKTIYNKSTDGIALIQNNRFKDCNEAIIKMFKYDSVDDVLNRHISELMPKYQPDGQNSVKEMLKKMKEAYKNGSSEVEWLHKTTKGDEFWTQISLTYIHLDGEDLLHGAWRDITDRKKLEEEAKQTAIYLQNLNTSLEYKVEEAVKEIKDQERVLYQQSRLAQMGEMMSMIAHQWRQPLSAISATSSALNLKAKLGKADRELIEEMTDDISEYSQHLSQTIDDFREFFKPSRDKKDMTFNDVLKSVLSIIEVSMTNQNIKIIQELDSTGSFSSYPNELKQVILNLVKNAEDILLEKDIKDPYIKIATCQKNSNYILEVSDNGGGIPEDIIDKVFDPYFSTKKDKNGTGLGLYMSKTIVEEHCGGRLSVENSADGALFTITLS